MKDVILLELVKRWEDETKGPFDPEDDFQRGRRETKRECADTLRSLIAIIGDKT